MELDRLSRLCASLCCLCLVGAALLRSPAADAVAPLSPDEVPAPLAPWLQWVMHGESDPACPYVIATAARQCVWPGRLSLVVGDEGARFTAEVETWSRANLPLPGREGLWPQDVRLDDAPAIVTPRDGVPTIALEAGVHRISGRFDWSQTPETLQVPPAFALLALELHGAPVPQPQRAPGGELWLQAPSAVGSDAEQDSLRLQVYRRVIDELPLQVETLLEFDVSGTQREVALDGARLGDAIPMRLDTPLPTRLAPDGRLRIQVRPGHWQLRLLTRQPGPVASLARPAGDALWPAEEVWVFDARPALRLVDVTGGTPVDPRQTTLPEEWRALPAFRLAAGESLVLKEQRRGDPEPEPDRLQLQRALWLDFDGEGYTVQDTISGQLTRGWRLDAGPSLAPGRVLLNGEPQFITEFDGRQGVEVRRGALDMRADSRIEAPAALNAVGWAHEFDTVSATLHLPPGWRLWSAHGVDSVSDTWLQRWTLLDLFIVFIVALAAARLWSWPCGLWCLVTLVLCWHEPGAPRQIWLHVFGAVALARVLPTGRLRTLVAAYRNLALLALLVLTVNFAIAQIRTGLFPQLLQAWRVDGGTPAVAYAPPPMAQELAAGAAVADAVVDEARVLARSAPAPRAEPLVKRYDVQATYDPQANIQTGPGLPGWQWQQAQLGWSGPVTADQPLELVLLSPRVNLLLACVRVVALAVLLTWLLRRIAGRPPGWQRSAAAALLLLATGGAQAAGDGPDPALLEELKRRLLLAPECAPACVSVPRLAVTLADARLQLRMSVHVQSTLGVPLPGQSEQWLPETVLVDGAPGHALMSDEQGRLMLALPRGVHEVLLDGPAPRRTSFQLALPVPAQRAAVDASGWAVDGIDRDSGLATQLIFTRLQTAAAPLAGNEQTLALPPFFTLERTLELGLDWRVHTRLVRVTPPGIGTTLSIPLLDGESVTTAGLEVDDGAVRLELGANDTVREWTSVLPRSDRIVLRAPDATAWAETWRADIAPIWHAALAGIPVVHHQSEAGQWLPTWRPWPGEEVTLTLSRPAGVPGRTLTIDRSELRVAPGQRASDVTLEFTLRSSQGGQHVLELPADVALQSVAIDDVAQPIRQEGRQVTLPVVPGEHRVALRWRSTDTVGTILRTPAFSLGSDSVNAGLVVNLPANRWVLYTGGPALGPAVLFWGTLLVVAGVAVGLGRARLAPIPGWQWLLLGVGLTQTEVAGAALVIGWLLALGLRERLPADLPTWQFNLAQLALALLSVVALGVLFEAIRHGLLGQPAMQIAGNGSSADELRWFVDRAEATFPQAWVLSVSIWIYRGLMLAWALWLAFALLGWLRWGWRHFARDGVWRRVSLFGRKADVKTAG